MNTKNSSDSEGEEEEERKEENDKQKEMSKRLIDLDKELSQVGDEDEEENLFLQNVQSKIQDKLVDDVNQIRRNFSSNSVVGINQKPSFMLIHNENLPEGILKSIIIGFSFFFKKKEKIIFKRFL